MNFVVVYLSTFLFLFLPNALGGADRVFWPSSKEMPQKLILAKRKDLRSGTDVLRCLRRLRNYENQLLKQTPWGSMSVEERVDTVYHVATSVLGEIKSASGEKFQWVFGDEISWNTRIDGHSFHRDVGPRLASCIVYQETRGRVHPLLTNYTYCLEKMISSAHGLGQVVLTTLRGILDDRHGRNFFPMVTTEGKKIKSLMSDMFGNRISYGGPRFKQASKEVHLASSGSPAMQMEMIYRVLNEKAKFLAASPVHTYSLPNLIYLYDQDNASEYVKNVMQCHDCMMAGGTPLSCYRDFQDALEMITI